MKMAPPKILLPEYAMDSVRNMLRSFEKLDRGRLPCQMIAMQPDTEYELSRLVVRRENPAPNSQPGLCRV